MVNDTGHEQERKSKVHDLHFHFLKLKAVSFSHGIETEIFHSMRVVYNFFMLLRSLNTLHDFFYPRVQTLCTAEGIELVHIQNGDILALKRQRNSVDPFMLLPINLEYTWLLCPSVPRPYSTI